MTKLILNCKPATLRAGDVITIRKADGAITVKRGREQMRFRHSTNGTDRGDNHIFFGKPRDLEMFHVALKQIICALTSLGAKELEGRSAYRQFVLENQPKGDA